MTSARRVRGLQLAVVAGGLANCSSPVSGSVRQYAGTPMNQSIAIDSTSAGVVINNLNGGVWVDTGGSPSAPCGPTNQGVPQTRCAYVSVTAEPFATGSDDAEAVAAANALQMKGALQVAPASNGGVTVSAQGDPAQGFGYDLTVHLPYPFGGTVTINAANGYVYYVGSSGANSASINAGNGDIFVQDGGKQINIEGGTAPRGRSNITVITLPTLTGFNVMTSSGSISAQIPQATVMFITARAAAGGTVTPPPNKDVFLSGDDDDDDDDDDSADTGGEAVSVVAPDHKSATVTQGSPFAPVPAPPTETPAQTTQVIKLTNQCLALNSTAQGNAGATPLPECLTVWTGNGNIVFH